MGFLLFERIQKLYYTIKKYCGKKIMSTILKYNGTNILESDEKLNFLDLAVFKLFKILFFLQFSVNYGNLPSQFHFVCCQDLLF